MTDLQSRLAEALRAAKAVFDTSDEFGHFDQEELDRAERLVAQALDEHDAQASNRRPVADAQADSFAKLAQDIRNELHRGKYDVWADRLDALAKAVQPIPDSAYAQAIAENKESFPTSVSWIENRAKEISEGKA